MQLALQGSGGPAVPIAGTTSAYLLSGASRTFRLAGPAVPPAGARLVGTTDTGTIEATLLALAPR